MTKIKKKKDFKILKNKISVSFHLENCPYQDMYLTMRMVNRLNAWEKYQAKSLTFFLTEGLLSYCSQCSHSKFKLGVFIPPHFEI